MEFILKRTELLPDKTFGQFLKDGQFIAYTLEDTVRESGQFVDKQTAIPYGRYRMVTNFSNRFKRKMIQLLNVRGGNITFHGVPIDACGIRIHGGNTIEDTLGCPLLGSLKNENGISQCAGVVDKVFQLVDKADRKEEVYLNIIKSI